MMETSKKKMGIVIVNYNGAKYQNDCLKSLYASTYNDFDVIIIDSASSDNSVKLAQNKFPDITVLAQNTNVGVAKGNNIGIEYCKEHGYEYICLLNNDIEIAPDMFEKLINEVNSKTIVVPKIYYYKLNDVIWFAGGGLDWSIASSYHIGINEKDNGQYDSSSFISYAPTCCMILPTKVFNEIGMFDEKYFMYFDDTDLCVRIDNSINYKIKYVPSATMWHKVSSSAGGQGSALKIYYITRNHWYYMDKYKKKVSKFTRLKIDFKLLVKYCLSYFYKKNNRSIKNAYIDYKKGNMGMKL